MNEWIEIGRLLARFEPGCDRAIVAEVFGAEGSHYRRVGSRLLLFSDGRMAGGISAGCLEADIESRFEELYADPRPRLIEYDFGSANDLLFGTGLGCGGRIEVLVERIDRPLGALLRLAAELGDRGASCRLLTRFSPSRRAIGRSLYDRSGALRAESGEPAARQDDREWTSRSEAIDPPPRVSICGIGQDAVHLARSMDSLGWRVRVISSRDREVISRRYGCPNISIAAPELISAEPATDRFEAAVVMSHNFLDDLASLEELLKRPWAYLGVVGPRGRTQRLFQSAGLDLESGPEILSTIRSPAGLDLGAETPEEIAFSIAAEIQAVRRGRYGGSLRSRRSPIHGRIAREGFGSPSAPAGETRS